MSSCKKDLCDYGLVRKCGKCGIISLKNSFHKDKTKKVGLKPNCKVCRKQNYNENPKSTEKCDLNNR